MRNRLPLRSPPVGPRAPRRWRARPPGAARPCVEGNRPRSGRSLRSSPCAAPGPRACPRRPPRVRGDARRARRASAGRPGRGYPPPRGRHRLGGGRPPSRRPGCLPRPACRRVWRRSAPEAATGCLRRPGRRRGPRGGACGSPCATSAPRPRRGRGGRRARPPGRPPTSCTQRPPLRSTAGATIIVGLPPGRPSWPGGCVPAPSSSRGGTARPRSGRGEPRPRSARPRTRSRRSRPRGRPAAHTNELA